MAASVAITLVPISAWAQYPAAAPQAEPPPAAAPQAASQPTGQVTGQATGQVTGQVAGQATGAPAQHAPVNGPRVLNDWEEGEAVPYGYQPVQRTRRGLIIGGAVTFGVLYFISVLIAAANDDAARKSGSTSEAGALYIPAVGPFVQMTKSDSSVASVFLAIDGLAQTGGVVMFIAGLTMPKTVLMRSDTIAKPTIMVAPMVARGSSGIGLVGTF